MKKVQNRFSRLITGTILPSVVFAFITSIFIALGVSLPHLPLHFGSLPGFIGLILAGWLLAGIQSIFYSLLMEYIINPGIAKKNLVISASGLLISSVSWSVFPVGFPLSLLGIGFLTGCIVGFILSDMYKHYA